MAYTIYQYYNISLAGEPLEPAAVRIASQALGASVQMDDPTVFVVVVPDAAMKLRISPTTGSAATAADYALEAAKNYGFPISRGARPWLYGL